jgi:hypothetical protein
LEDGADRVRMMNKGTIVLSGSPADFSQGGDAARHFLGIRVNIPSSSATSRLSETERQRVSRGYLDVAAPKRGIQGGDKT